MSVGDEMLNTRGNQSGNITAINGGFESPFMRGVRTVTRRTWFLIKLFFMAIAMAFWVGMPIWGSWLHLMLTGKPMGF